LLELEENARNHADNSINQLSLFEPCEEATGSAVEEKLAALNIDDMTPREALQALYDLKEEMD